MTSKYITYGVFFGAVFGLIIGALIIPIYDSSVKEFAIELVRKDLERHGIPENEMNTTLVILKKELDTVKYWMPIAEMINFIIYGLIIGGITQLFYNRVRVKAPIAAVLAFLIALGVYSLILYGVNVYYSGDFIPIMLKHVPLWYILLEIFGFMGIYLIMCSIKGPWERWFLGGPKHY
ncbi:MAG: hypothetical protein DRN30_05960 [Thermoplasmata archaeon]|nr:hypothetical protein [Euryarchaeota archaeon]RLF63957.1 MAG: hypothetical protein DRN30_05960 [Thermoplasmata archaeon]